MTYTSPTNLESRLADATSDIAVALDAAASPETLWLDGTTGVVVTPPGWSRETHRVFEKLAAPDRTSGSTQVHSRTGLFEEVERQRTKTLPAGYVDTEHVTVTIVLNPDSGCDHTIKFRQKVTPAYQEWLTGSGSWMSQEQFADFITDHASALVEPPPATMLEVAECLTVASSRRVSKTLPRGNRTARFELESTENASAGEIVVPTEFMIQVMPFIDTWDVSVNCALRWKLSDGDLKLSYRLCQVTELEVGMFEQILSEMRQHLDFPIVEGSRPIIESPHR